jgi:hypothetical protein
VLVWWDREPLVYVTITVLGPAAKVTVTVFDPPAESVTHDGETDAELDMHTVPANPLTLVTVTEKEQIFPRRPPSTHVTLPGATALKSWTV